MIKINRANCPDILKDSPSEGTHYNKKQVVKALWNMQHKKCCYCEQKIPEEGHLKAVEHFCPKATFSYLKNDWKNLLLACAQCNGRKASEFPVKLSSNSNKPKVLYLKIASDGNPLIIDPSNPNIDPEEHIDFIVDDRDTKYGCTIAKNNSYLGMTTIKAIGLNRRYYTDERKFFYRKMLLVYYQMLIDAEGEKDEMLLQTYKDKFKLLLSARGKFSALARTFARHKRLDKRFGISILVGAET
ncbi:hypothetical protein BMS3Abin06_01643 [bacterium BMS3Abin06]|nr:hypothetical protein BMS3Abin06_01643 [bacterium BMS3Abin06]